MVFACDTQWHSHFIYLFIEFVCRFINGEALSGSHFVNASTICFQKSTHDLSLQVASLTYAKGARVLNFTAMWPSSAPQMQSYQKTLGNIMHFFLAYKDI